MVHIGRRPGALCTGALAGLVERGLKGAHSSVIPELSSLKGVWARTPIVARSPGYNLKVKPRNQPKHGKPDARRGQVAFASEGYW